MDFNDKRTNWQVYGQPEPPIVDLKKVKDAEVPVAIFASKNDLLSDISDQRWARDQLLDGDLLNESETLIYYKEYEYGHYSFMVAKDMQYLTHVKQLLEEFNKPNKR